MATHEETEMDVQDGIENMTAAAVQYGRQCRELGFVVDPCVSVWLRFGGDSLQISGQTPYEGCLLPAFEFIAQSKTLRHLSLRSTGYRKRGAGNSNARVLRHILVQNTSIETLDLQEAGIDHEGLAEICSGLRSNKTLRYLNLRGNFLGHQGGKLLLELLHELLKAAGPAGATSLRKLDVACCSIGFEGVQRLAVVSGFRAVYTRTPERQMQGALAPLVDVEGNFETEEVWNAITHFIMFLLSILGTIVLMSKVSENPVHHIWGSAIFCFGLLFCFLSSTLYHSFFLYPRTQLVLQILDHTAIYVLIAGSYTPLLLFYDDSAHLDLLKAEWILCSFGIVAHVCSQYADWGTSRLYLTGELVLYLCMGWGAVTVWDTLSTKLPGESMFFLLAGGLLYTAGVPFFLLADYRPTYHIIWHLFVAAAATLHWFSVKHAAYDALLHHSKGPFTPKVEWFNEWVHLLRDEFSRLHHETQDQGLYHTMVSHAVLPTLLDRLVPGWRANASLSLGDMFRSNISMA